MTEAHPDSEPTNVPKIVITWDEIAPRPPAAPTSPPSRESADICSICMTGFSDNELEAVCGGCSLRYHDECWRENFGCAAYGCSQVNALKLGPDIRVAEEVRDTPPSGLSEKATERTKSSPKTGFRASAKKVLSCIAIAYWILRGIGVIHKEPERANGRPKWTIPPARSGSPPALRPRPEETESSSTNPPTTRISPLQQVIKNSIGMEVRLVPAGNFWMGSPEREEGRNDDETHHRVQITKSFYVDIYEVTQEQYQQVMGKNPSYFSRHGDGANLVTGIDTRTLPVEWVSWMDAQEFCRRLSQLEGKRYRLPTEAEWEYACRAGKVSPFSFGYACNGSHANCDGTILYGNAATGRQVGRPTPVGSYTPNAFGIFDMAGNVREWCSDCFDSNYYAISPQQDPQGPPKAACHVYRSGGWYSSPAGCRSAFRDKGVPTYRDYDLGFRVVLVPAD